jgi:hypothetical protein
MAQEFNRYLSQNQPYASKVYNTNQTHPIIPSAQQYLIYKKYVSIHSEDRNIVKYPNPSSFEIEMPEDLLNVLSISLVNWTFPANYNTFSTVNGNTIMSFNINPFNPATLKISSPYYSAIFKALFLNKHNDYNIIIETGFYNPDQMTTELTNKFNSAVTAVIINFLQNTTGPYYDPLTFPDILTEFETKGGYRNFVIVYNSVSQKIWFGNTTDSFTLTNEKQFAKNVIVDNIFCGSKNELPDFSNWGLPGNLGLSRCNTSSISGSVLEKIENVANINNIITPRFFYGDVFPGDEGYWLLPNPDLPGSEVHWIEATYKINLMGPAYFYIELEGQNCIDETSPYNLSSFTVQTNQTNGVVNSSFAKIAVPTTPISQWFDRLSLPYKEYMPPAERIRKLKLKIRYHNGQLVDFGVFDYSLLFEFVLVQPTPARVYTNSFVGGQAVTGNR